MRDREPAPSDEPCSVCGGRLWIAVVAGVIVSACPRCDRPHCTSCDAPFGKLLSPHNPRLDLNDDGSRCEPCLVAGRRRR